MDFLTIIKAEGSLMVFNFVHLVDEYYGRSVSGRYGQ